MNKYFSKEELACVCCGECNMDEGFIEKLTRARIAAGIPFVVDPRKGGSGYRCWKHNLEVGSASDNHPSGHAVDIKCTDSRSRYKIVKALLDVGFTRIGIHKAFIHVDDNPNQEPEVMWPY